MERLGQDLGLFRGIRLGVERHRGKAGDEHDLHARSHLGRLARQFDPIHDRHHDVGQQKVETVARGQAIECLVALRERLDLVPRLFKRRGQEAAHRLVVFSQKDFRHRDPCPR